MTGEHGPAGRRLARSVAWVAFEKWSVRLLSLVVLAVLTRLLDPAQFGLVSTAMVVVALASVFVDAGLSRALIRLKSITDVDASTTFWASLVLGVLLYVALFFSAPVIAGFFGQEELISVIRVVGVLLILGALSGTPVAILERDFGFKVLSLRSAVAAVAGAIVAVPMALLGYGVWALVANTMITQAVATIVLWGASGWRPRFVFSVASLRTMSVVAGGVFGVELLNALQGNLDKFLIGAFFGQQELGYYFIAQRALNILAEMLTAVIGRVSLTTFSRAQDDVDRLNVLLRNFTLAAGTIATAVFGLSAILAPEILPTIFGGDWTQSVVLFQILAPSALLVAISSFDGPLLIAKGKPGTAFGLSLGQTILGIGLMLVAAPFGVIGVAASRTARSILIAPVRLAVLKKGAGVVIRPYVSQIGRVFAAFIPAGLLAWLAQHFLLEAGMGWGFLGALLTGIVASIIFLALLWFILPAVNRSALISLVRRRHVNDDDAAPKTNSEGDAS